MVGIIDKDVTTITKLSPEKTWSRRINNKLRQMNLRVIILEDGRVFEDLQRESPEPSKTSTISHYINQTFGGRKFNLRFNQLYSQHKLNSK